MPTGEHEFVTEGMLWPAVVVAQPAELRPGQMRSDIVGRVRQRPAKMSGLGIIAEQHQGHTGHIPDVFEPLPVVCRRQWLNR